ncbi:MAG: NepR family anti-sigma factor [Hyphomicrobiales bacterium]
MDAAANQKKSTAKLGRDIQAKLGQQLRAMYDDVVSQGVPDRFSDLLNKLDDNGDKGKR